MSAEENKTLYLRFLDLLSAGNTDALPEVIDPERYREICVGITPGWLESEAAVQAFWLLRDGIPDLTYTAEEVYADGDRVIGKVLGTGTHSRPLYGAPPSGKRVSFEGVDIMRIADGKIVERWLLPDQLTMLRELGLMSAQQAG